MMIMLIWLNVLNKKSIHPVKRICACNICEKWNSIPQQIHASASLHLARCVRIRRNVNFEIACYIFQSKLWSSEGGELGPAGPKLSIAHQNNFQFYEFIRQHAHKSVARHILMRMLCSPPSRFSELFGIFLWENLRSASGIHTKSIEMYMCVRMYVYVCGVQHR